uniref:PNP_UDP_1 domain-containing protein n=1 Tax=Panagrellus redivivus TaxID=6233 RepID=A0A7E4VY66_PANRE
MSNGVVNGTTNGHTNGTTNGTANGTAGPQYVQATNPHLKTQAEDFLYHFGISKTSGDIKSFKDIKIVCCGGSAGRFEMYAKQFGKDSGIPVSKNLSSSDRFVMYKTGPVLWVNHGMGVPSMSIMLNEVIKLLHYAEASDVSFIRIGTSGGVGVAPGTVVVSNGTLNGLFEEKHTQYIRRQVVKRDAVLDQSLAKELYDTGLRLGIPVENGMTLCADDFYEGQMRLDGAFCEYTAEDKFEFLKLLKEHGVRNIEMEATGFASFTKRANVKAGIICVALLNRLNGDQVTIPHDDYIKFEFRPFNIVCAFIQAKIASL